MAIERWANIVGGAIEKFYFFDTTDLGGGVGGPPDPNPIKGFDFIPAPEVPQPLLSDPAMEVLEGPFHTIQDSPRMVIESWNVRPKTQQELDAELAARKESEAELIDRAQGKALFIHENRIRALEGLQPITKEQFRDWFKDQVT